MGPRVIFLSPMTKNEQMLKIPLVKFLKVETRRDNKTYNDSNTYNDSDAEYVDEYVTLIICIIEMTFFF